MIDYSKIKDLIDNAEAILIGAGAGLSTSAGINYGKEGFESKFPELVEKYGMTDIYTSSFYSFKTEEERWSYWAKHIDYLYNVEAKEVYKKLYELIAGKNYFVITTNVDGQFLKAGFAKNRVFEVQGSLSKIQCAVGCHDKLYDDLDMVEEMQSKNVDCKVLSNLIPICPVCKGAMEVNLRKDAFFVEDINWNKQNVAYEGFIEDNKDKRLLLIELGVGFNTPGIIRFPFESMVLKFQNTTLIRNNDKYCDLAYEIKDKAILVDEDCKEFIDKLRYFFGKFIFIYK